MGAQGRITRIIIDAYAKVHLEKYRPPSVIGEQNPPPTQPQHSTKKKGLFTDNIPQRNGSFTF
jgi:hypothetical protein